MFIDFVQKDDVRFIAGCIMHNQGIKAPPEESAVAIKKYLTITALYVPPLKEYNNILTKVRQKKE